MTKTEQIAHVATHVTSRGMKVLRWLDELDGVHVEADLTKYFRLKPGKENIGDAVKRGILEIRNEIENDPRVESASTDSAQFDQTLEAPNPEAAAIANTFEIKDEKTDWGITDIEADKLWDMPGAADGAVVGIMDTGFARHEDITFLRLRPNQFLSSKYDDQMKAMNHGNHVSGIACGRHNGRGVRGVLPNCFIRPRTADVFFSTVQDGPVKERWFTLFSQILYALNDFLAEENGVSTYNVSMGYNWVDNFNINPELPSMSEWRNGVEAQGLWVVRALEVAASKDKFIFSAAGNDSENMTTPLNAKYASPFNWAAITARETGKSRNGIIVEAHDKHGKRASFSNVGGHISCPGMDITSAVAFAKDKKPSKIFYALASGTSMASPNCAAAHVLLQLVRPGLHGLGALSCMMKSSVRSSSGTPMLRLTQALKACPR